MTDFKPKTYILRRKERMIGIPVAMVLLVICAFGPLLLGVGMMSLIENATGQSQHEGNSIWGVLPWLSMFTMVIFLPAAALLGTVSVALVIRDAFVLWIKAEHHQP